MKTIERQIIEKQDEIIDALFLKFDIDLGNDPDQFIITLKKELSALKSQLSEPEVKESFTSNDIDLAYLTGCFNVVGIDGLSKEIERLKGLGLKPHDIFKLAELFDKEQIIKDLTGEKIEDVKTITSTDYLAEGRTVEEISILIRSYLYKTKLSTDEIASISESIASSLAFQFQQPITDEMIEAEFPTIEENLLKQIKFDDNMDTKERKACIHSKQHNNAMKHIGAKWALSLKAQPKTEILPLNLDNAWSTENVLIKLIWATKHLLHEKNYDGHGYEELNICVKRGEEILESLKAPKAQPGDEGGEYCEKCKVDHVTMHDLDNADKANDERKTK